MSYRKWPPAKVDGRQPPFGVPSEVKVSENFTYKRDRRGEQNCTFNAIQSGVNTCRSECPFGAISEIKKIHDKLYGIG